MPVTLAQASQNAERAIDRMVIDEFRKSSFLFDNLTFNDVVNPTGQGATLTFGYRRLVTQATAQWRAINAEYIPQEAGTTLITGELKVFGGSYQIDRVLAAIAAAAEVVFQQQAKINAVRAHFNDAVINGDSAVDARAFDGLARALTGSSTELGATAEPYSDWRTIDEAGAFRVMEDLDSLFGLMDGAPTAILANAKALAKIKAAARRAGYFTRDRNSFGQAVDRYGDAALVDVMDKAGSTNPVIAVETRNPNGVAPSTDGLTDVYAVRLGLDALHAMSLAGVPPVRTIPPDFRTAGAVKTGEVEMVAAIALKATKSAAVLRNVRVQ